MKIDTNIEAPEPTVSNAWLCRTLVLDANLWSAYTASDVGWLQKRRCPSLSIRKVYLDMTDSSSLCDALGKYAEVVFI